MTTTTHACDFEDNAEITCETCDETVCRDCAHDLSECWVCQGCMKEEEKKGREAEEALRRANAEWFIDFGELPLF